MDQFIISQNVTPDHSAAFNVIAMGKMLFLLVMPILYDGVNSAL